MIKTWMNGFLSGYPHLLRSLEELLSSESLTEIVCWNLKREVDIGSCPRDRLLAFLREIDDELSRSSARLTFQGMERLFLKIRKTRGYHCLNGKIIAYSHNLAKGCDFCQDGTGVKGDDGDSSYPGLCTFVKVESFHRHNRSGADPFEEYQHLDFVKAVAKKELIPEGILSAKNGFVWITKIEDLKNYLRAFSEEKHWEKARNILGERWNDAVILVGYPSNFKPYKLCAPTFIEGGLNPDWRCDPRGDGWNSTVNMESGTAGLPEAIHCPAPLTPDFTYEVLEYENDTAKKSWVTNYDCLRNKVMLP